MAVAPRNMSITNITAKTVVVTWRDVEGLRLGVVWWTRLMMLMVDMLTSLH